MAAEREFKFLVAGAFPDVGRLAERYGTRGLTLSARGIREQRDVYFDTPELSLLQAGVALRQRRFEKQTLATFKSSGTVHDGLHVRDELELPHTDPWPAGILERLTPLGVVEQLAPLALLSARRERFLVVKGDKPQAELTFDEVTGVDVTGVDVTGLAVTGSEEVRFRELELELFPGTEVDLATLTAPLDLPGLTPHAGDKLSHTLRLLGRR